ncbi:MAG: pilus assembly protein N-terminal domain-containing protein [Tabrizicola sp.]|nr:pilus assembly protein N-terminal domain-containing protein [Tabrizicola sp.]
MRNGHGTSGWHWLVLGLAVVGGSPAASQTADSEAEAVAPCVTNVGPGGQLLSETLGLIYSPVAFDAARTEETALSLSSEGGGSPGVLVCSECGPTGRPKGDDLSIPAKTRNALVEFTDSNDTVVHKCAVEIVDFDPAVHDLTELQVGDCDFTVLAGLSHLLAGHAQVLEFPQEHDSVGIWPPYVADQSTLSSRETYLLGKSPGLATLIWERKTAERLTSVNLCPVQVVSAIDALGVPKFEDKDICLDQNGVPMRLGVGQVVSVPLARNDAGDVIFGDFEFSIAADAVADAKSVKDDSGSKSLTIEAVGKGTTSFTIIPDNVMQPQGCEIIVE